MRWYCHAVRNAHYTPDCMIITCMNLIRTTVTSVLRYSCRTSSDERQREIHASTLFQV